MLPKDYCEKWIPLLYDLNPGDYGYKRACIDELSKLTGFATKTVKNWDSEFGKAPVQAKIICGLMDRLRTIEKHCKEAF